MKEITPDEIKNCQVISVQKIGDYWNWRKFRKEPLMFYIFTSTGIFEYKP